MKTYQGADLDDIRWLPDLDTRFLHKLRDSGHTEGALFKLTREQWSKLFCDEAALRHFSADCVEPPATEYNPKTYSFHKPCGLVRFERVA